AYQVEPCANGRSGQCVQQTAPIKPIEWQNDSDAFGLVGDTSWSNYTVTTDVDLEQAGTAEIYGRANTQDRPQSDQAAYLLRVNNNGGWSINRSDTNGNITSLAGGTTTALGTGSWHTIALTMQGSKISATIDGKAVGSATDGTYTSGQAGIGVVGYQTDQFDNLTITPGTGGIGSYTAGPVTSGLAGLCLDDNAGSNTNGNKVDIYTCNGTGAQVWQYTNGTLQNNGSCLDVVGNGATADGTLVDLWSCNGGNNQVWNVVNGTLVNPQSGKCLDDPGLSTTAGTQLDIWDCNGGVNQNWALPPAVGPVTVATNGMCLDDANNSTADGNKIDIWGCNAGTNQQWELTAANTLVDNGKCLDVTGGATADGTLVELYTCNGTGAQTWQHQANGELLNPNSGKCLDDPGFSGTAGTQVDIWDCNAGTNQQWSLPTV
ncbi:MAG TPA: ricin-type beta-trefoil lectin domain protein, partial [Actinocrinis sp.]|nr:ricin-type beta-trefoil lectin domain protein [Actinocrinis sp.]